MCTNDLFKSEHSLDFSITNQSGETDTFEPSPACPVGMVLKIFAVDSECRKFSNLPLLIKISFFVGVPSPSNGAEDIF